MSRGTAWSRCYRGASDAFGIRAASRCRTARHCPGSSTYRTGILWEYLPKEPGFDSGMTCWRRLRDGNEAGVWQRPHEVLLAELNAASGLDWSRWVIERSIAWLHGFRRLRIRWERRADIREAFLKLACCLITQRQLNSLR